MTAEICVANRSAIVLAADSAATVTHWQDGAPKERYYKGANKVFQFSETEPVGVMIYDSCGAPLGALGDHYQGLPAPPGPIKL